MSAAEPNAEPTQLEVTKKMVRVRKGQLAAALANREEVPAGEIAAVTKLELQVDNMEAFERLREMTREPPPPAPTACSKTTKKGEPCRGRLLPGRDVCVAHR